MRQRVTVGLLVTALVAAPVLAQRPHGQCSMGRDGGMGQGSESLNEAGLEAVGLALQDEYRSESLYKQVLEQLGEARPFAHIVYAEQRHSAALERVYSRRGLVAPDSKWRDLGQDLPGETLQQACQVAVEAERDNVSLYDELLERDLPADVVQVFQHLRQASLERHLPAFERCAAGMASTREQAAMGGGCCGRCDKRTDREAE